MFSRNMSDTQTELRDRLKGWMEAEDIPVEETSVETCYFRLIATKGRNLRVDELKAKPGIIYMTASTRLADSQIKKYESFTDEEKQTFMWAVRLTLIDKSNLIRIKDKITDPTWLMIQKVMYKEDLTREHFMEAGRPLLSGLVMVTWLLESQSGSTPTTSQSPGMYA